MKRVSCWPSNGDAIIQIIERLLLSDLNKYNISVEALNEPNPFEIKILESFNKTVEDLYREATFKLNRDFFMYVTWWIYDNKGWQEYKIQCFEGNENFIKVNWKYIT